jgi:hypothetical protein
MEENVNWRRFVPGSPKPQFDVLLRCIFEHCSAHRRSAPPCLELAQIT